MRRPEFNNLETWSTFLWIKNKGLIEEFCELAERGPEVFKEEVHKFAGNYIPSCGRCPDLFLPFVECDELKEKLEKYKGGGTG